MESVRIEGKSGKESAWRTPRGDGGEGRRGKVKM